MANRRNPYKPGAIAWHEYNLRGNSRGHVETLINVPSELEATGVVYGPTSMLFDAQKALNDVRTLYQGQQRLFEIPEELME